jgi:hypothetical protein
MHSEVFSDAALKLEILTEETQVRVRWSGKSTAREPGPFIVGVVTRALDRATRCSLPLVLDFQSVDYMNSSTITPVIRLLTQARRNSQTVRVVYARSLKWQTLSFTALNMFQTNDGLIEIRGV